MVTGVDFLAGARLWLLLGVAGLVAAYLVQQRRRGAYALRFTNLELLASVAPRSPGWRRHVPPLAFLLMLLALVVAFARPVREVRVPVQRANVVLAIDVSLSMQASDVSPTRLGAVQQAATRFLTQVPAPVDVGVVSFGGTATVLVPPTTDRAAARAAIAGLQLAPSTAIGEAVFAALGAIADRPADPGRGRPPARIVLMSDGATTVGRSNESAAAAATAAKVPIYTIAFGTDSGYVELAGHRVDVPVDAPALARLAEATGGRPFRAGSGQELRAAYSDIGSAVVHTVRQREISGWFVGLALLLAATAGGLSLRWFSRLP